MTITQREKLRDDSDALAGQATQYAQDGRTEKAVVSALLALRLEIRAGAER